MSQNEFARSQLKKHGWTEGQGLGREEHGMREAIKVQVKNNKTGIGHDPGAEFTHNWWDDAFNKAARSIQVEATEDGHVRVGKKKEEKKLKKKERKKALYGNFIKGATLTQEDGQHVENKEESSSAEEDIVTINKPSEEELFERCGGRTAHKGARHGLALNGKLQRINEMEQRLLSEMEAECKTKKRRFEDEEQTLNNKDDQLLHKKKKKKKKKKKYSS